MGHGIVARHQLRLAVVGLLAGAAVPLAAQTRLEVGYISREPIIAAPQRPDAPTEEGWPGLGQRVQWVGHLLNRGSNVVRAVPYSWRVDDETVAGGTVDMAPGRTVVLLPWRWTFDRHTIELEIRPPAAAADLTPDDDTVVVLSDALSLALCVQQGVYNWLTAPGRPGFERWAQTEIARWNAILARAVYPTTPQGAHDRIRLDRVVVLPDGQTPTTEDRLSADLFWYFQDHDPDTRFLQVGILPRDETIVLHELLHLRGLVDLYAYVVKDGGDADNRVDVAENGRRVAGTELMPSVLRVLDGVLLYLFPVDGLMGDQYNAAANLTEHCANGLNLRAGRRTPLWVDQFGNVINGFSNAVQRDSYVSRLARRTEITLLDGAGTVLPGAMVDVFLDHSPFAYQKLYAANPDRTLPADGRGVVALPGNLLNGLPSAIDAPPKSLTLILRVRTPRGRAYTFLPVYDLNLAYFRQGPELAQLKLQVDIHPW